MPDQSIIDIDPTGDVILIVPADLKLVLEEGSTVSDDDSSDVSDEAKARFRVSSKHLTLASGYFNGRLGPQWLEGQTLMREATAELQLSNVQPADLKILLLIIHGRHRQVPESVPFDQMVRIAELTDYLDCQEIVEPFGRTWVTDLMPTLKGGLKPTARESLNSTLTSPTTTLEGNGVTPELPGWMMASFVFHHNAVFESVTKAAQRSGIGRFDAGNMAIPRHYIQAIDFARENYLTKVIQHLRRRMSQLIWGPSTCGPACDALYLGLLMRFDADNESLLKIRKPYRGLAVDILHRNLGLWKAASLCTLPCSRGNACGNRHKPLGPGGRHMSPDPDLPGCTLADIA